MQMRGVPDVTPSVTSDDSPLAAVTDPQYVLLVPMPLAVIVLVQPASGTAAAGRCNASMPASPQLVSGSTSNGPVISTITRDAPHHVVTTCSCTPRE